MESGLIQARKNDALGHDDDDQPLPPPQWTPQGQQCCNRQQWDEKFPRIHKPAPHLPPSPPPIPPQKHDHDQQAGHTKRHSTGHGTRIVQYCARPCGSPSASMKHHAQIRPSPVCVLNIRCSAGADVQEMQLTPPPPCSLLRGALVVMMQLATGGNAEASVGPGQRTGTRGRRGAGAGAQKGRGLTLVFSLCFA